MRITIASLLPFHTAAGRRLWPLRCRLQPQANCSPKFGGDELRVMHYRCHLPWHHIVFPPYSIMVGHEMISGLQA